MCCQSKDEELAGKDGIKIQAKCKQNILDQAPFMTTFEKKIKKRKKKKPTINLWADCTGTDIHLQNNFHIFGSFLLKCTHVKSKFVTFFAAIVILTLLHDKILDVTKVKVLADNKINVAQMMISGFDRAENIVGKGENAGYQHFLLFPQCFQKASFLGVYKSRDCMVKR